MTLWLRLGRESVQFTFISFTLCRPVPWPSLAKLSLIQQMWIHALGVTLRQTIITATPGQQMPSNREATTTATRLTASATIPYHDNNNIPSLAVHVRRACDLLPNDHRHPTKPTINANMMAAAAATGTAMSLPKALTATAQNVMVCYLNAGST